MITLTDKAQKKIKDQLKKRGKGLGIKIGIKTTGCSGLAYVLEYFDEFNKNDQTLYHIVGVGDVMVVVDRKHEVYLKGLVVDYVREGLNEGFRFENPNERDRCGCGESFRI
jgi:iron-sulfur cluster assembly protein